MVLEDAKAAGCDDDAEAEAVWVAGSSHSVTPTISGSSGGGSEPGLHHHRAQDGQGLRERGKSKLSMFS